MGRKLLGIDIRDDSLTAVLVSSGVKGYSVETYQQVRLEAEPEKQADIQTALVEVIAGMDLSGAGCVVALPGNRIFYRNIKFPFKGYKKIRQILPVEMESELPVTIEELVFDFYELTGFDGEGTNIMAMAAQKHQVGNILKTLARHHLEPEIITAGGFPMTLCLLKFYDLPNTFIFLDIDTVTCSLFLVNQGNIVSVRCFVLDSHSDDRIQPIMLQVYRTLMALEEKYDNLPIPEVVLTAGQGITNADNEHLTAVSQNILGIPARIINIMEKDNIRTDRSVKPVLSLEPGAALAAALVEQERLSCPNFRTGPFAPMKQWEEYKHSFIKAGVATVVILLLYSLNVLIHVYAREQEQAYLDHQIIGVLQSSFPDAVLHANPTQQMREAIQQQKSTALFPTGQSLRMIDILNEMSRRIPPAIDVEFQRLVIDSDHFILNGNTDTFYSVDEIQGKMEASPLFHKVDIMNTGRSGTRIQFRLRVGF